MKKKTLDAWFKIYYEPISNHSCQIWRFIVILTILSSKNSILTIWRFMPLFWEFLEMKKRAKYYILSYLRTTVIIFWSRRFRRKARVRGPSQTSKQNTKSISSVIFYTRGFPHTNRPTRERILSVMQCAMLANIDELHRNTGIRGLAFIFRL